MNYFLGVDVGNTKSHALIADENGRCLGFGLAGCGSWEQIDWTGAEVVLKDIVSQAINQAGIHREQICGAGFGFAGYDWPEDRAGHEQIVQSLQLTHARCELGNDTLVGLMAGATAGWGVVVVAGTGNNCRGWDKNGREGRMTGMSHWFAEYGGAGEIVRRAVQAVALAWSKRGPQTQLTQAFISHVGAADTIDLLAGLVRDRYYLQAAAAPLVFTVAQQGDKVAQEIIRWAGQELGSLANGVIRQLNLEAEAFEIVLSGSLYQGDPLLIEVIADTVHALAPQAQLVKLTAPPVVGGVILAMKQVGLATAVLRSTLITTANALIASQE